MLQQTQVKTVLPYYKRFLRTYPTLESLARAEEEEVLSSWAGLGYYSRARNLHRAAQIVCEQHSGEFPSSYDKAMELPGIGRYTAGAILSISRSQALPILDGNINRFLSRYLKIEASSETKRAAALWALLETLVKEREIAGEISEFNQALMEIGAQVCTPRNPRCHTCPLSCSCMALAEGLQTELPPPRKRRQMEAIDFTVALASRGNQYLLRQSNDEPFLKGFWEFPRLEGRPVSGLAEAFRKTHGLKVKVVEEYRPVSHQITFRKLTFYPVRIQLLTSRLSDTFVWTQLGKKGYPVSSYVRKIVRNIDSLNHSV
jgi:A/G-specific adenine glycosylase